MILGERCLVSLFVYLLTNDNHILSITKIRNYHSASSSLTNSSRQEDSIAWPRSSRRILICRRAWQRRIVGTCRACLPWLSLLPVYRTAARNTVFTDTCTRAESSFLARTRWLAKAVALLLKRRSTAADCKRPFATYRGSTACLAMHRVRPPHYLIMTSPSGTTLIVHWLRAGRPQRASSHGRPLTMCGYLLAVIEV